MASETIGYEWKGAEELRQHLHPIDKFTPHPRNVRRGNVDVLARSLQKFGQMAPIVVQKSTGYIIKGNHTWKSAKFIGWQEISATVVDCNDEIAYHYLLADNKASDLADYDKAALARSLSEIADQGKLGDTLWTADDMDDLQAAVGTLETLVQEFKGDYSDDPNDRKARLERELTRVAPKMREVPIVVTVEQHRTLMENIKVLQGEYFTDGAIETILLAVQKEADRVRQNGPQPREDAAPAPTTAPAPPPAPQAVPAPPVGDGTTPPPPAVWSKESIWKKTGSDLFSTLRATHVETFDNKLMIGIVQALHPEGGFLDPATEERRRAVQHLQDAFVDSPLREFSLQNASEIINRITNADVG